MSKLFIIAENRSDTPALFVIDVFEKQPKKEGIVINPNYDQRKDPGHLFRYPTDVEGSPIETRPGMSIKVELEIGGYEAKYNDLGPLLWFRMPRELQNKFYVYSLTWNGKSMIKGGGMLV